jgi:hypothetical protein
MPVAATSLVEILILGFPVAYGSNVMKVEAEASREKANCVFASTGRNVYEGESNIKSGEPSKYVKSAISVPSIRVRLVTLFAKVIVPTNAFWSFSRPDIDSVTFSLKLYAPTWDSS